jgi:hypothetical protein
MAVVRGRLSSLPSFGLVSRSANPRATATHLIRSKKVAILLLNECNLMTTNQPSNRFTPLTQTATTHPVLLIDTQAPLPELHACASERLHATLDYLTLVACSSLRDSAASDLNTLTNVARILVQDVADVFGVIERRGLEG